MSTVNETHYPCETLRWNDARQKDCWFMPLVTCRNECDDCPWNPAEAKRRIRTGRWVTVRSGDRELKKLIFRRQSKYDEGSDAGEVDRPPADD